MLVEFTEAVLGGVVVVFEMSEVICLADQVGINGLSISLNLATEFFFFVQLGNQLLFLTLKSVELFPELGVKVAFKFKVLLKITVNDVLEACHLVKFEFQVFG